MLPPYIESNVNTNIELSASVICLNMLKLEQIITDIQPLGIHRIHVDFIDNEYSGLGLPKEILSDLREKFSLPIDVHLMVSNPEEIVRFAVSKGVDCVAVHQTALTPRLAKQLLQTSRQGTEVSLVLNPGELPNEDSIQLTGATRLTAMSVKPGAAGRPFEPEVFQTMKAAARLKDRNIIKRIEVDGAIGPDTFPPLVKAGAEIGVVGSTVLPNRDTENNQLRDLLARVFDINPQTKEAIA